MIDITEQDGELLIDGKPVDFQAPWKVEDAIRQLRAEIKARDSIIAERDAEIATLSLQLKISRNSNLDLRVSWERAHVGIAERDAQITGLQNAVDACILQIERDQAERTRLQMLAAHVVRDEPEIDAGRALIVQSERIASLTGELARLRAQGPVAWMWNDMIGIPHTHISPTRPTWPDAGASSAMSVAINVRPLYAEPMPAKSHPDICPCQTQPTHYAGEMPCPLSQAAKVAE